MKITKTLCLFLLSSLANAANILNNISPNLSLNGYLDVSANYLSRNNKFSSGTYNRAYDINPNGLALQQASLILSFDPPEGFGVLINPVVGRDPTLFAPYGWDPDLTDSRIGFALLQAYLQYNSSNYSIVGGQLINSANYESPVSTNVRHYSRSILWNYGTPTTNTGVQGNYKINEQLTIEAGLNNGWDSIKDFRRPITTMAGFNYAPNKMADLTMSVFSGGQRATDKVTSGTIGRRTLVDIITTFNVTEELKLAVNYDYVIQNRANLPNGKQSEAVWHGIAGYMDYQLSYDWWLSFRAESFSDRDGFITGVAQNWKEATLTIGYMPLNDLELRAEARQDYSNKKSFVTDHGKDLVDSQYSVALQGLYKF